MLRNMIGCQFIGDIIEYLIKKYDNGGLIVLKKTIHMVVSVLGTS